MSPLSEVKQYYFNWFSGCSYLCLGINRSIGVTFSNEYFEEMVIEVNRSLEPLGLAFRRGDSELDGRTFWALVSCMLHWHSKVETSFAPGE